MSWYQVGLLALPLFTSHLMGCNRSIDLQKVDFDEGQKFRSKSDLHLRARMGNEQFIYTELVELEVTVDEIKSGRPIVATEKVHQGEISVGDNRDSHPIYGQAARATWANGWTRILTNGQPASEWANNHPLGYDHFPIVSVKPGQEYYVEGPALNLAFGGEPDATTLGDGSFFVESIIDDTLHGKLTFKIEARSPTSYMNLAGEGKIEINLETRGWIGHFESQAKFEDEGETMSGPLRHQLSYEPCTGPCYVVQAAPSPGKAASRRSNRGPGARRNQ